MNAPLPVYLVDDDPSVADACRFLLEGLGYRVHCWISGDAFLDQVALHQPGCVILDMRMPGLDGDAVRRELLRREATLGMVMLTAHGDIDMAVEAMKQGVVDFLQKPVNGAALTRAVSAAHADSLERYARHCMKLRVAALSPRECEVVELVSRGLTNRAIADALHLAIRTVEVHRANAMQKLDVGNTAELAGFWQQWMATQEAQRN